jgi:hypothetical protein
LDERGTDDPIYKVFSESVKRAETFFVWYIFATSGPSDNKSVIFTDGAGLKRSEYNLKMQFLATMIWAGWMPIDNFPRFRVMRQASTSKRCRHGI